MHAYYADHFVLPLPEGHRFPMRKYSRLRDRLTQELPGVLMREAPAASDGELALVHTPTYIQSGVKGQLSDAQQKEIGFPWTPAMAERSVRSAGASIAAGRVAMKEGIAGNLAGGTHHASANQGGGFCVFNDIAVTARVLQMEHFQAAEQLYGHILSRRDYAWARLGQAIARFCQQRWLEAEFELELQGKLLRPLQILSDMANNINFTT